MPTMSHVYIRMQMPDCSCDGGQAECNAIRFALSFESLNKAHESSPVSTLLASSSITDPSNPNATVISLKPKAGLHTNTFDTSFRTTDSDPVVELSIIDRPESVYEVQAARFVLRWLKPGRIRLKAVSVSVTNTQRIAAMSQTEFTGIACTCSPATCRAQARARTFRLS